MHAQEIAMTTESDRHVKILDGPPDLCPNGSFVIEMPGSIYSGSFPVFDAEFGVWLCLIVALQKSEDSCFYEPSNITIGVNSPTGATVFQEKITVNQIWPDHINISGLCKCSDETGYYSVYFDGPASCYAGTIVVKVRCNDPRCDL